MQPRSATRGIAAVALSSAAVGILLLALALVLSACTASSSGSPATSSAASSTAVRPTSSSSAPVPTPTTSAPASTAPATSASATANPDDPGESTIPSVPITTAPPVPITAPAPAVAGGSIRIGTITSIQGTAQLPGEIAGPAVQVPVAITNGSGAPLNLEQVVVDLVDSAGVSAGQLSAAPAAPFTGTLAPRATANAVYVFSLATNDRRDIRIVVSYTTAAPVVVFTGSIG